MREKYIKHPDPVCPDYITYAYFSNRVHFTFKIRESIKGDVVTVISMEKRISHENRFTLNDLPGNSTKKEFDAALKKVTKFILNYGKTEKSE